MPTSPSTNNWLMPFKVYIPSEPGKYGIKISLLFDASKSFCWNFQVCAGKIGNSRQIGQAQRVTLEPTNHLTGKSHNLVGDNFFTDFGAIKQLLSRQRTYCETMRKNK